MGILFDRMIIKSSLLATYSSINPITRHFNAANRMFENKANEPSETSLEDMLSSVQINEAPKEPRRSKKDAPTAPIFIGTDAGENVDEQLIRKEFTLLNAGQHHGTNEGEPTATATAPGLNLVFMVDGNNYVYRKTRKEFEGHYTKHLESIQLAKDLSGKHVASEWKQTVLNMAGTTIANNPDWTIEEKKSIVRSYDAFLSRV